MNTFAHTFGILIEKEYKITTAKIPQITIIPQTEHELEFFREMLSKMKAKFIITKSNDSTTMLSRIAAGLIEAKKMKEGKLPESLLSDLCE
ncbi:MAG: hypothetical protein FWF54_04600 [Candidatus Azobacteroides sp.]|nr:hypothetical protein [Candidatus Azobacteroides sp.]